MWRSLFLSLAIAAAGRAQDAAGAVEIRASRDTVVVARTLGLSAAAFTDFGRPIDGFTPRWRSVSPEIATVDDVGVVTGIAPGLCAIEAADPQSGVSDRIVIRVYPARIEITPDSVVLDTGAQQSLRARVLDANGAAIPGVP